MFETQESTPWYRSRASLVAVSLFLLILLGTGYFFVFRRSNANEAHYAALEQQRAQQRAEAQAAANTQAPAGVVAQPAAPGQPARSSLPLPSFRSCRMDGTPLPAFLQWPETFLS